jgi:hypothetical protein
MKEIIKGPEPFILEVIFEIANLELVIISYRADVRVTVGLFAI